MAPPVRWPKPESPENSWPFEDGPVVVTGSWGAFRSDNAFVWSVQDLGGLSEIAHGDTELVGDLTGNVSAALLRQTYRFGQDAGA